MEGQTTDEDWSAGNSVLVLTGGSDVAKLADTLPRKLDAELPKNFVIHWVQGPYSDDPAIPFTPRLEWILHKAPSSLVDLMNRCQYAFTIFGISFFELLYHGVPTVMFSPYGDRNRDEIEKLKEEKVALIEDEVEGAVQSLARLMHNEALAKALASKAKSKINGNGAVRLAAKIGSLIERK